MAIESTLSPDTVFAQVDGYEVTEVPDGFVIYDENSEKVHYLNPTAAVIYTIVDGERSVAEISDFVRVAYERPESVDLDGFFIELEAAGLVCRAG